MDFMQTTIGLIREELQSLPSLTNVKTVLLDEDLWARFVWELESSPEAEDTELKSAWRRARRMRPWAMPTEIKEVEIPKTSLKFRRNAYIKGIRVIFDR